MIPKSWGTLDKFDKLIKIANAVNVRISFDPTTILLESPELISDPADNVYEGDTSSPRIVRYPREGSLRVYDHIGDRI